MKMTDPYTLKQLTEVDDSAAKHGFGEMGESRFATGDLEAERTGVSFHRLRPGARQPFAHRHSEAEEVYVVISGSGRIKLDDEIVELERLDAVRIGKGVMRCMEGGPDGIGWIAFGAPPVENAREEAELVQGWWRD
jgi:mannose-6-phosphate isomerase-like protein (cupin superfamily)